MDEETAQNFFKEVFERWVNPEILARQNRGEIENPYALDAAQIIFAPDGSTKVRLNSEVRGIAFARVNRPVEKDEAVTLSDWSGIENFDVCEGELDNGHITVLAVDNRWFCAFNFLRRRSYCCELLTKAKQFLDTAAWAHSQGFEAASIENLFSSVELTSKAFLILNQFVDIDTNHKAIHSRANREAKLSNMDGAFVALFNKLSTIRYTVRYDAGMPSVIHLNVDDFILVDVVIKTYQKLAGPKSPEVVPGVRALTDSCAV